VLGPLLRLSFDRGVPLATNIIFDEPGRDGELARALNVALHAVVVHTGMRAISEGEDITLNFAGEIETVQRARIARRRPFRNAALPGLRSCLAGEAAHFGLNLVDSQFQGRNAPCSGMGPRHQTGGSMSEQHKPGETVKTSGIYKVVKEGDGGSGFEVTCVEGEHFPPTRSGKGAH
jgi:hypothetical protein